MINELSGKEDICTCRANIIGDYSYIVPKVKVSKNNERLFSKLNDDELSFENNKIILCNNLFEYFEEKDALRF